MMYHHTRVYLNREFFFRPRALVCVRYKVHVEMQLCVVAYESFSLLPFCISPVESHPWGRGGFVGGGVTLRSTGTSPGCRQGD